MRFMLALSLLKQANEACIGMTPLIFAVDLIEQAISLLGVDCQQNRVDLGFHAVVALLGLGRSHMQKDGEAGDLPSAAGIPTASSP
jgi:hypothetical protein